PPLISLFLSILSPLSLSLSHFDSRPAATDISLSAVSRSPKDNNRVVVVVRRRSYNHSIVLFRYRHHHALVPTNLSNVCVSESLRAALAPTRNSSLLLPRISTNQSIWHRTRLV